uniref:tRNA(Ile)-lysidine synthase n=1 Tax=Gracilaria firma TaxID=2510791 RepID=A0A1P8D6M9_9FLOR|nr:tRNA(Ile)-lysidine synthase [Gracilaria firma]APR74460.1 tRNA(Ile)-lysidine synthase [Gracilaria firma]
MIKTKTYIYNQFLNIVLRFCNSTKPFSILIAISGGKDSLCLVKLIEDFNNIHNYFETVQYIYIDHQWRNDSKQNIQHLLNYIDTTKNEIHIYQIRQIQMSESSVRKIRYQIMVKHATKHKAKFIFTAHNQTDQLETFLLNLVRGTGLEGLSSLPFARQINNYIKIIRPLIDIETGDISWFCHKFNLPIWSDKTNYYYSNYRNRIRYELFPYLKQYFSPNIEYNIINFLKLTSIENEYIKQNAIKLYIASRHSYYLAINYRTIKNQHLTLQRRVLNIFFYYNFNKCLNIDMINQIIQYLNSENKIKVNIIWKRLNISIHNNWIYIK